MSDFLSQFENKPDIQARRAPRAAERAAETDVEPLEPLEPLERTQSLSAERGIHAVEHHVEVDPDYRRTRTRRRVLIAVAVVAVVLIAALAWYFSRLVEVPDFAGKPLSEAQTFARDKDIELEVTEEFRLDVDTGVILSQGVEAGRTVTKGSVLPLSVSKGPDPGEHIELPDFATMKRSEAERWIAEMRADNLRIVLEFSDTVPKDDYLRIEFRSNDITAENYRRNDYATLYYSKGVETFEKNIAVPNFAKKTRADVESWAATNGIRLTVEEVDSDTIEAGFIISQSIKTGEKLARNDEFGITVSLGKALVVPNFANYTAETAAGAAAGIPVNIETRFNPDVPYGQLIWQSVAAGTRLLPADVETVTVVYSEGRPYLKDYRGTVEGDIPASIFRDYTSKGAYLSYDIRYVDSWEDKGTVVGMSDYSRFIPLEFYVIFDVSRGNLAPPPKEPPDPDPGP